MYHVDMLCAYAKVQINTTNKLEKNSKEKCYNVEQKFSKRKELVDYAQDLMNLSFLHVWMWFKLEENF